MPRPRKVQVDPIPFDSEPIEIKPDYSDPANSSAHANQYLRPLQTASSSNALTGVPSVLQSPHLDWQVPNFQDLQHSNLFAPSSSNIPQTDDTSFAVEMKVAHDQNNSLKLLNASLNNVLELANAAVNSSKIAQKLSAALVGFHQAQVSYQVGTESAINDLEIGQAKNAARRSNGFKEVSLLAEKGRQIDQKLRGEQIRTSNEARKADHFSLESSYLETLTPVLEEEWSNKLEAARAKATAARVGTQNSLNDR